MPLFEPYDVEQSNMVLLHSSLALDLFIYLFLGETSCYVLRWVITSSLLG
jgi:hypothetical protein